MAGFSQHLVWLSVVIAGVYQVIDGYLSQGGLIACAILSSRVMAPMTHLVTLATRYNQARSALSHLNKLMSLPDDREQDRQYSGLDQVRGEINLESVYFSYPGLNNPALEKINFHVNAGEKVAIIGSTGSGKTTIVKLMLGLYKADQGSVRIDGLDIRQLDPALLRRRMGYIAQDVMLFYGSVGSNIAMGAPYIEQERVRQAAEFAGVSEFTDRHPQGLDMPVGERGEGLSGGQRQAVAIARAFLLEPSILLMDEPTSAMDKASESRLKKKMQHFCKDRTVILVTHRTSLLDLVDRLIVLDAGHMIADGAKDDVLAALRKGRLLSRGKSR